MDIMLTAWVTLSPHQPIFAQPSTLTMLPLFPLITTAMAAWVVLPNYPTIKSVGLLHHTALLM